MAIRDRIRRALRSKSNSSASDSASHAGSSNTTTTATDASDTTSLRKINTTSTSTFSRVFAFGSRDKGHRHNNNNNPAGGKENRKDRKRHRPGKKPVHPSQRPLTLQNLRHQEMLSHFTMTFGASDPSQIESLSFCGVSPCCTRPASVDLDRADLGALSLAATPASGEPTARK
ncbi:hypothetical protein CDD83_1933 [Cordyceps sp. RAO-2017]|nr:hypothetical protein CDD83_1933 [Cordyceps sp. RAO-2017]